MASLQFRTIELPRDVAAKTELMRYADPYGSNFDNRSLPLRKWRAVVFAGAEHPDSATSATTSAARAKSKKPI